MNTEALLCACDTEQRIFISVLIYTLFVKKVILKIQEKFFILNSGHVYHMVSKEQI